MDDPQSVLITSEQRRIELSQELQRLMCHNNKSDRLKEIQLKSQMESIKSQRQKSLQRNQMIRRQMQEFEINMSSVAAKTQALRSLKNEYEEYIERLYPQWKEQVLSKAAKQRDKEQRLMSMRRDISLSQELPSPDTNLHQQYDNDSLTHHQNGYQDGGGGQLLNGASTSHQAHPEMPIPHRSSTPEYSRTAAGRSDRGLLSTSLQSINSEKSVTFDESSLRPPSGQNSGLQLRHSNSTNSRNSPRRHTPSPSELIRTSLEFGDASSQDSTSSFRMSNSAAAHSPQHATHLSPHQRTSGGAPGSYQSVHVEHHLPSNQQPSYQAVADETDYSLSTRVSTQRPAHGVSGVTAAPAHGMSGVTGPSTHCMSGVTGAPMHGMSGATSQVLASQLSTESVSFGSVDLPSPPRRMSGPEVVIPSTSGDISDDGDSPSDSIDKQEVDELTGMADHRSNGQPLPSASVPVHSPARLAPEVVSHSLSSLNTTATEEPPAIDLAKTDEFKSLLGGQASARTGYESDDSEDSMVKAIENEYSKQLALKTNTMPMQGPITLPTEAQGEPSPEEGPSDDDDELTSPMGYTPSFASNMKPSAASDTKYIDSLQTLSSTGDSKNSSGSRRAALRRTNSDVESESDFQTNAKKGGSRSADDEVDDDDFYG